MRFRVRLPDRAFATPPFLWIAIIPSLLLSSPLQEAPDLEVETQRAVQEILGGLEDLPLPAFWDAVARLEALGKDALPVLLKASGGTGDRSRLGAAKAILSLGDEAARQAALKNLAALAEKAADRGVRAAAIELLGEEDAENSAELIRQIFESSAGDPETLIPAAKVLGEIDPEPGTQASIRKSLLSLVKSRDRKVRFSAALALAEMDHLDGEVREALRELRQEPSPRGRLAAALLDMDLLARRADRRLDEGEDVLPGADASKILKEKETRIRELEAQLAGILQARGGPAGGDPVLEEIIEQIQAHYIDPDRTRRKELILAAIKGMVSSLDDYSRFFDLEETEKFLTDIKGEYVGIGATVSKLTESSPLEVVKPFYGGGAYESGIRTGDKILEIDGFPTENHPIEEIQEKLLKGPEGSTLTVKVLRRGWSEPRDFKIPRRLVVIPSVFYEMLPGGIGYLRLITFGDKSADEFDHGLRELEASGLEGLVIDLRHNPGGRLEVALHIVDLFIGETNQPILIRRDRNGAEVISYPAQPGRRPNYPLAVLINGRSASASEIVAGALKDFHRATLIGQRTFGKGSVQSLLSLSDRSKKLLGGETRLKLTTQHWYLPSGRCIQTVRDANGRLIPGGVEPDIPVEMEQYNDCVLKEIDRIRHDEKIFDYINKNYAELKSLAKGIEGREAARWKGFDELYRSLETLATPDQVRQVVRFHLRRRLEDEQGKEFPSDFQEDNQLQRGILEVLRKLGKDPADLPEYAWLKGKTFGNGKGSGNGEGGK